MQVKIIDIYVADRVREEMGDIEDLARDFEENGQITAITVRPPTEAEVTAGVKEPWVLVAGGRRLRAAMRLGWRTLEAYGREAMDEITHRTLELNENIKRKEMTPQEIAKAKEELFALRKIQNPGITATEVAAEIGDSPATFSRDLEAAEALRKHPELERASSRKAILRAAKMAKHVETRSAAADGMKQIVSDLEKVVVTADMLEWLPQLDEGSVDLMIPDLPYGINFWKAGQKMRAGGKDAKLGISEYDDTEEATAELFEKAVPLMVRATKKTGWLMLFASADSTPVLMELLHKEHLSPEPVPWIWYRPNSRNASRYPDKHAQNQYEYIVVCNRGEGVLKRPCGNVLVYDAVYDETRIHANQKPIDLYEELIGRVTFRNELICDPCFGSGASLAAAVKMNRRVAGCDKNPGMLKPALGHIVSNINGPVPSVNGKQDVTNVVKTRVAELLSNI